MYRFGLIFLTFIQYFCFAWSDPLLTPVIRLKDGGQLQGLVTRIPTSDPEAVVWEFLGIPYAKPPIGPLRFRPTVPNEPWTGVFKAVKSGPLCQQLLPGFIAEWLSTKTPVISEDCLHLNVWVPVRQSINNNSTSLLPVMVAIHGGGFYAGSSVEKNNNDKIFANAENVIVVSMAYRLSIFGFLYSGGPEAPGNVGLLDQLEALKWVHKNIEKFGGDQTRVTIFGVSAGSGSTSLHALSPLSQPYFSRLILQSGVATNPWVVVDRESLKLRLVQVALKVGCKQHHRREKRELFSRDQFSDIVKCLASKPADQLLATFTPLHSDFLQITFTPVMDGHFLTEMPAEALKNGRFKKTDIMLGTTRNEATMFLFVYYPETFQPGYFNRNLTENKFRSLLNQCTERKYRENQFLQNAIYMEYENFGTKNVPDDRALSLDKLGSDVYFTCDTCHWARRYNEETNTGNVFHYVFDYGDKSLPEWLRSLHGSDWRFVFGYPIANNGSQNDVEMSKRMMRFWANFARTGNPNINLDGSSTPQNWPAYGAEGNYAILDINQTSGHDFRKRQCYFWHQYTPGLFNMSSNFSPTVAIATP